MIKTAPTLGRLAIISGFIVSCFGILLFLWVTFGGPTPLAARSYVVKVPFNEATTLGTQSDVRISGVSVGKVQSVGLAPDKRHALATIYMDPAYAPLPSDTRAILRTKTLLGESYVELTPGTRAAPKLPDGGTLALAQVAPTVQLDEILRTFDPKTRAAFRSWMQNASIAIHGRGQSLSDSIALLQPTFTEFDRFFRILDTQKVAVRQFFRNGATTFRAFAARDGELASLIRNSNTVFSTTAQRNRQIERAFIAFPTFEDESRLTLDRLRRFALNTDPLMRQLVPAARQLSPTLVDFGRLAPQAKGFFEGLAPVINGAPKAFPAFQRFFGDDFPPLLNALQPFLRNINPLLEGVSEYKHELTALLGNATAATNAVSILPGTSKQVHYLRTLSPLGPESLATFPRRLTVNRNNPYTQAGLYSQLIQGLTNFDDRQCSGGITATLDPNSPNNPSFNQRTGGDVAKATDFFDRLKQYAFGNVDSSAGIPAPGCGLQGPFNPLGDSGAATQYQHALEQPTP